MAGNDRVEEIITLAAEVKVLREELAAKETRLLMLTGGGAGKAAGTKTEAKDLRSQVIEAVRTKGPLNAEAVCEAVGLDPDATPKGGKVVNRRRIYKMLLNLTEGGKLRNKDGAFSVKS